MVIDDSYNASPAATRRALDVLRTAETSGRRIAVLGEMLELGDHATELHEGVGRAAAAARLDVLIAVGGEAAGALADAAVGGGLARERVQHVATSGLAADAVAALDPARRCGPREGIARRAHGPGRGPAEGGARLMLYYLLFKSCSRRPAILGAERDALHHVPHGGGEPVGARDQPGARTVAGPQAARIPDRPGDPAGRAADASSRRPARRRWAGC